MQTKIWSSKWLFLLSALLLALAVGQPARADLKGLSPDRIEVTTDFGPFDFPRWYMDSNSLMLQACLDNPDFCLQELAEEPVNGEEEPVLEGLEFIYWAAETQIVYPQVPGSSDAGRARFIFALEAFADVDPDISPDPIAGVFNAAVIRLRGLQPLANYTIFHPFAADGIVVQSDNRGRLDYEDPLLHPEGDAETLFLSALTIGPIQHFLYSDTLLPVEEPLNSGNFYIGMPTAIDPITLEEEGHTVFGSPFGRNFVRVEGPGLPGGFIESNKFVVGGQIFFNLGQNLAPIANFDVAKIKLGELAIIDVLDNDLMQGDVPINPTSLEKQGAIGAVTGGGTVATVREFDKVLLRFTPPATAGLKTFNYTVETFTGAASTSSVSVFVENLLFNQAEYRARTGKWALNGTSNFRGLSVSSGTETTYFTGLFGAQEVPPVTTEAKGMVEVTIPDVGDTLSYLLEVDPLPASTITAAHIHCGATGVNGGILVHLCGSGEAPACTITDGRLRVEGIDVPVDAQIMSDLRSDLQAGNYNYYVNVHTSDNPGGEVRGQLGVNVISLRMGENGPAIGAAEVQAGDGPNLPWSYSGKSVGSLGAAPHSVHAESALNISETMQLRLR